MKAAVFHDIEDIRIEERQQPQPGPFEALLRIEGAGICGTDRRIFKNGHRLIPPGTSRILGHELVGQIEMVGDRVPSLAPGMRVGIAPNMGCGVCQLCVSGWTNLCPDYQALGINLDGAFAQYMLIPALAIQQGNVVQIPAHVSAEEAALAEPLSCCINGQEALDVSLNDVVVIIGDGPIGHMHALLAKLRGARTVIMSGKHDHRLEPARQRGADVVVNIAAGDRLKAATLDVTNGEGADVVIVAASAPRAQEAALELAAIRGRINYFGGLPKGQSHVSIDANLIHYRQLVVTGTTGSNLRQYRAAMTLIAAGRVRLEELVSLRLPLERLKEGMGLPGQRKEMKVLVEP